MNFSSDTIELFLAVLDRGSFSGAARALGRVPSAVSMGIANLEAELGFALFERTHREARPTALARADDRRAARPVAGACAGTLPGIGKPPVARRGCGHRQRAAVRRPPHPFRALPAARCRGAQRGAGRCPRPAPWRPDQPVLRIRRHQREPAGALPVCRRGIAGRDHLAAPSRPAEAGAGAVPGRAGERAADPGGQLRPAVGRHPSADCRRLLAHRQPGHGAGNGRGGDRLGQFPVVPGRAAAGNGKAGTPGLQEYQERAETACPRYLAEKPAIAQGRPGTGWHAGHPSRLKRYAMHFTEKTRPVTRIAAHAGSPASST
ncbi:putative transcriptional regulator [Pseudomonas aeruginosa DK2]|nr:putative transcriptional regulator [Pseudomonas aeruginosa DK2]EIE46451.1 putative transcriptional regulator [Pseudomonas aeruginosa PADK2_CF510]